MIDFRTEILNALPIPDFFTWWWKNWTGTGFHVWADELLEMEKEGIVKIERGRVELVEQRYGAMSSSGIINEKLKYNEKL